MVRGTARHLVLCGKGPGNGPQISYGPYMAQKGDIGLDSVN